MTIDTEPFDDELDNPDETEDRSTDLPPIIIKSGFSAPDASERSAASGDLPPIIIKSGASDSESGNES